VGLSSHSTSSERPFLSHSTGTSTPVPIIFCPLTLFYFLFIALILYVFIASIVHVGKDQTKITIRDNFERKKDQLQRKIFICVCVCVCVCVCARARACMCGCECMRKKERERERDYMHVYALNIWICSRKNLSFPICPGSASIWKDGQEDIFTNTYIVVHNMQRNPVLSFDLSKKTKLGGQLYPFCSGRNWVWLHQSNVKCFTVSEEEKGVW
jgi:hypothetical protein